MDGIDDFPLDPSEWIDSDMDGVETTEMPSQMTQIGRSKKNNLQCHFCCSLHCSYCCWPDSFASRMEEGGDDDLSYLSDSETKNSDNNTNETMVYSTVSSSSVSVRGSSSGREGIVSAPSDAKMNDNGQLVWVDESGNGYCQNPDGLLLFFDQLSGSWGPLNNQN